MAQIDLKNVTIKLKDGTTPTANEITVKVGEGNLTYTETRNIEYTLDRGVIDEVREGDEAPMDITLDFLWDYIKGNTDTTTNPPTVEDVLKQQGNASTWISTDPDQCRPFAIDVELDNTPNCTGVDKEVITLTDFRYETLDHDARAGTVSVTGRCNAKVATIVRTLIP